MTVSDIVYRNFGIKIEFDEISTDTRSLKPNSLFLALKGNNFNGNDFVEDAYNKGAKGAIIEYNYLKKYSHIPIPIIGVEDTLETYQKIAKEYVESKSIKKIAITGSSGKTTTKEFIRAVLSTKFKVFANQGNFNNQIGVPFSVLNIKDEEIAIIEMGTGKPGDIQRLAQIFKPHIGIVTSVGEAHIEFFGCLEEIAKEKASITSYGAEGITVNNIRCEEYFRDYKKIGLDIFYDIIEKNDQTYDIRIDKRYFNFKFWGEYNLYNLAIAVYIGKLFNLREEDIIKGIESVKIPSLRWERISKNGVEYILDCYNANPLSMKEVLKSFSMIKTEKKKIAILGDMLELGEYSCQLHNEIGKFVNTLGIDTFIFYGEYMREAFKECIKEKYYFDNKEKIKDFIKNSFTKDAIILLKGSRGMRLEEIIV